jgi:hypothetical protein
MMSDILKVGDKVRVLEMATDGDVEVGTVGAITDVLSNGVVQVGNGMCNWFLGFHGGKIELIKRQSKVYTQEMADTVEHKGKVYQIGCFYEFKDETSSYWEVGVLCDYEDGKFKSKCGNKKEWYDSIMRCTGIMGTVVDAPIALIHGKAYQFTNIEDNTIHGIYN